MSSNESGNLMDEFEEAFQNCLVSLAEPNNNMNGVSKEELEQEVQKTTNRFIDLARQMEGFFLQKRFLVSTLKPDMLIKDENQDLRMEIQRKETLLNKHYNRLEEWKACLSDIQQSQGIHSRPVGPLGAMGGQMEGGAPGMGANRPGIMPGTSTMPPGGQIGLSSGPQMQLPQMQSQLQQQKMMQAQQLQQLRMMGKLPK